MDGQQQDADMKLCHLLGDKEPNHTAHNMDVGMELYLHLDEPVQYVNN
jgi:hypothetical protein